MAARVRWIAPLGLLLWLAWFFRTWFHDVLLFFFARPEILQGTLAGVICWRFLLPRWSALARVRKITTSTATPGGVRLTEMHFRWLHWAGGSLTVILILLFSLFGGWLRAAYLARTLEYHRIAGLPESVENVRLMPYEVAHRYGKDSLQLSQYRLGTENMVLQQGRLTWVFPLTPDGLIIKFLMQNKGLALVDATTQEKNSRMVWRAMRIGEGMQLTDNLWWNLYRIRYWVRTEYPYYVLHGGDIYTAVPAIDYQYRLSWGVVFAAPRFAGTFLVDTAGNTRFLTPAESAAHPVLAGNRIFPEFLARQYVDAYQYHKGIANRLFIHEDQIQIQDVPSRTHINRQPFLMMTAEGLKWFISTEPYGASHGIFKIFLVDAVTGRIDLYQLPAEDSLTGPVRAMDYVRRANPVVDWSRFLLTEPLPFVRNGDLYWKIAVIPEDAAGIAYQAFVDSRTNRVTEAGTDAEILAFIEGDIPALAPPAGDREAILEEIRSLLRSIDELVRQLEEGD
ncbi:MAG: hypothetical protein RDU89_02965 [bacterium]|nr:hypothetical protein [bacterium]